MTRAEELERRLAHARREPRHFRMVPIVFWACLMFPLIISGIVGFVLGRLGS